MSALRPAWTDGAAPPAAAAAAAADGDTSRRGRNDHDDDEDDDDLAGAAAGSCRTDYAPRGDGDAAVVIVPRKEKRGEALTWMEEAV